MSIRSKLNFIVKGLEREFEPLNVIEINRKNILYNFDFIQKLRSECQIWPVLKSNAYGHGIKQIAEILKARKFDYFVTDSYFEALKIWEVNKHQVLLIGSMKPVNFKNMNFKNLAVSVQDFESLNELIKLKKKVKIHIKVNTGMNRQGFELSELEKVAKLILENPKIIAEGIFSHLADADNTNNEFTEMQEKKFNEAIKIMEDNGVIVKYKHLAATSGCVKVKTGNAIRLGIGLYGFNLDGLKPALRMISCFTKVREIKKGEKVSYNGIYKADKNINTGVIPVGYFEGLDRRLSNKGFVKYKDKFLPIIGRICMNLSIIDLGIESVKLYDNVEIISSNPKDKNSVYNLAKFCETIPYEILVKLNETIRRKLV